MKYLDTIYIILSVIPRQYLRMLLRIPPYINILVNICYECREVFT